MLEPKAVNAIVDTDGPTNAVRQTVAFFPDNQPTLTFIHLEHVVHADHEFGYELNPEYLASVEVADQLIGEAIARLPEWWIARPVVEAFTNAPARP